MDLSVPFIGLCSRLSYVATIWTKLIKFIMSALVIKSSLKCTLIYAADIESRQHFKDVQGFIEIR